MEALDFAFLLSVSVYTANQGMAHCHTAGKGGERSKRARMIHKMEKPLRN